MYHLGIDFSYLEIFKIVFTLKEFSTWSFFYTFILKIGKVQ